MYIRGHLVLPDRIEKNGLLQVEGARITGLWSEAEAPAVKADVETEGFVCPGFVDIHCHGGGGADFMDGTEEAVRTIAATHARHGTTGLFATTLTGPGEVVEQAVRAARTARTEGARIVGYHIEGPYINGKMKGAQNGAYVRKADQAEIDRWLAAGGREKRWHITIAPEIDGHLEAIRYLNAQGVVVSAGHTEANLAQMEEAVAAGVRHATHLFNAMRGLHHREPGTAGAAMTLPGMTVELIADGVHVHPSSMKIAIAARGAESVVLVTDAMMACGLEPGEYELWELPVVVKDGEARLKADGTLAGSVLTMDQAVANMVKLVGVDLVAAVRMASTNPARLHGLAGKGALAPGMDADIAILGADLGCQMTLVDGTVVYRG